jgi:AcrR family transcriptional regulator
MEGEGRRGSQDGAKPLRSDVQRNLERVLQAAQELFAERGPEVKMGEVAARAGVGVGTIYRRFPSKELLFAAVSEAACADTCLCLARAADDAADPAAKLRAIVIAQYSHSLHLAPLLDSADAPGSQDEAQPLHRGLYPALHALLAQVIAAGQAQGRFRAGDPAVLAALAMELLDPRAVLRLHRLAGDCAAAAEGAADFIIAALSLAPEAR